MKAIWLVWIALMSMATTCQAQPSVTLYGALDLWVGQQRAQGNGSAAVLNSGLNPNLLGLAGHEDLGGGIRAGFVLEAQPFVDTGSLAQGGKFFGRQSVVYLAGPWGRLNLGRLHTAGRAFGIKHTATGWLSTDALGQLEFAMGAGISPATNVDGFGGRVNNAVSYESPRLGGFSASVLRSAAEGGPLSAGAAKVTILALGYAQGPFSADLVLNLLPAMAASQIQQRDLGIGATYELGAVKLFAAAQSKTGWAVANVGATTALAGSKATDRLFVVGAQLVLGPQGRFGASIGRLRVAAAHRGLRPANVNAPFASVLDDAQAWSVSYTYLLSKRTSLFAAYGTLDNAALGTASLIASQRPLAGGDSSILATGIRLAF